ncbi:putative pyruvate formate lyase activating enzyme [Desulfurella multipotens]|uniref:Putative pyruvate formate lyase activating enzyme n=1 Tax=Desulfurella multipotens TaxID=79269 RepID=A0A1G6J358_9BACT|nr:radical SAM protein [Desulfurella multipotens]SDC13274.1 putative pyruvate formate lyase activating enzyme [Desulfurella multipotens]
MLDIEKLVGTSCRLCPRNCKTNRNIETGLCKTNNKIEIASFNLHFGEEPPISGNYGSGTVFFAGCNMACVFCQNYPISQLKSAYKTIDEYALADIFLELQNRKAHNINLVTPSHFVHLICKSIEIARQKGFNIPVCYNTSSYDKVEVIEYLNDYVDIYLADLKYADDELSYKYSGVSDYFKVATRAIIKMQETKGPLILKNNLAIKGLIIRHLVLPNNIENSKKVLDWIVDNIDKPTISLMRQYFPAYKASLYPELSKKLNNSQWNNILDYAYKLGIDGYFQVA